MYSLLRPKPTGNIFIIGAKMYKRGIEINIKRIDSVLFLRFIKIEIPKINKAPKTGRMKKAAPCNSLKTKTLMSNQIKVGATNSSVVFALPVK